MDRYSFQDVYDSLIGTALKSCKVPGVDNAFEEGSLCSELYEEVYSANLRLCQRLGAYDEDKDVETIVGNMFSIQRELCYRMYCWHEKVVTQQKNKPIRVTVQKKDR